MKVVMDSDCLIKLTRAKAKEVVLRNIEVYKLGKITLAEAAELSNVSLRKMMDILEEQGIKGNVSMKQQIKAIDYAKKFQ